MSYVCTTSKHFRIDESELLYMTVGEWVVSFEGYAYHDGLDITWNRLGPSRNKEEWYGADLGLIEQCDFNSNDWWSPRYDFDGYGHYFDDSMGNYPFDPLSKSYWRRASKYMLWEANAWKQQGFGTADNFWSAKTLLEESVWEQLTNPYNNLAQKWNGDTTPLEIIEAQGLDKSDVNLQTIYLYQEFDSKEQYNEIHKDIVVQEHKDEIKRILSLPYGKSI
jgi:hypothetical protein